MQNIGNVFPSMSSYLVLNEIFQEFQKSGRTSINAPELAKYKTSDNNMENKLNYDDVINEMQTPLPFPLDDIIQKFQQEKKSDINDTNITMLQKYVDHTNQYRECMKNISDKLENFENIASLREATIKEGEIKEKTCEFFTHKTNTVTQQNTKDDANLLNEGVEQFKPSDQQLSNKDEELKGCKRKKLKTQLQPMEIDDIEMTEKQNEADNLKKYLINENIYFKFKKMQHQKMIKELQIELEKYCDEYSGQQLDIVHENIAMEIINILKNILELSNEILKVKIEHQYWKMVEKFYFIDKNVDILFREYNKESRDFNMEKSKNNESTQQMSPKLKKIITLFTESKSCKEHFEKTQTMLKDVLMKKKDIDAVIIEIMSRLHLLNTQLQENFDSLMKTEVDTDLLESLL